MIGLNYRDHAVESGLDIPEIPVVFAKFPASVTGPYDRILFPRELSISRRNLLLSSANCRKV